MLARSWFDALKSRLTRTLNRQERRASGQRGPANRHLRLEGLEDRCLLAIDLAPSFPVGIGPQAAPAADFGGLQGNPHDYDSTRILVRFRPEADVNGLPMLDGTSVSRELPLVAGLREVRLAPGTDVETALAVYRADPLVVYAQPNYRVHVQNTPNDPGFGNLWGLHNTGQTGGTSDADIDAVEAWDNWTGNGSTIVAVIDTGVDYTHSDLAGNMWTNPGEIPGNGADDDGNGIIDDYYGANFIYRDDFGNPTGDPYDDHYHGTHVAGTIGAIGDNGVGVTGVSWDVQIMAIKFLDSGGGGYTSDAIDGLNYAVSMGAMISNNSWGGGPFDQGLYDAIQSAGLLGHVFIAAAGNSGVNADSSPMYPAAYDLDSIISVAATDHDDALAYFSNYGATSVDLGAPGVDIYSTMPGNTYGYLSGTSMASPHVSGVAALIRDLNPGWTAQQVKDQLLTTVDQISALSGISVTGGRLNAAAAVTGTPPPDTTGPRITAQSPFGTSITPVSSLRVTFSESINPGTFGVEDIGSFMGPGNVPIVATAVTPVVGSSDRQFDITFADQSGEGVYTMIIGPEIQDIAATPNRMDQDRDGVQAEVPDDQYTANFTIDYFPGPDGYGYEAHPIALEAIDLVLGMPDVFTILDNVDDDVAAVDLGSNTFTFYGVDYTGANSLFVSSNGLISFGYGVADYTNTDLSSYPEAPAIAPLWDDWVTHWDASDEVLGKFEDVDGNGTADRLVIEWNVYHYSGSPWAATFQAILGLNAGGPADPIILNYPNLDTGDGTAEGQSATVGIKDNGAQGPNRLLVSADSASPFFGTGQALRIAVEPQGPALHISNASVTEGDSGPVEAVFIVTLINPPTDQTVTVNYATADGSATEPGDYISQSGPLSFPPGTTSQEVRVVVNGDVVYEVDETFIVNLSSPAGAVLADGQGVATILNDDPAPELTIDDLSIAEGNSGTTSFVFTVTLINPPAGQSVTVDYATADGSGTAGSDYQAVSGTLTFAPGVTSQTITVLANGDALNEADETFFVNLSSPAGAVLADGQGAATILNDDPVPTLAINDRSALEGNSGTTNLVFTVSLSAVSGQPVTVNFLTANDTATAGSDYQTASGTLTIPAGQSSGTITVLVNGDRLAELDETFFVNLSAPTNAVIADPQDAQGMGTVLDNEPRISINDVSLLEGRNGRQSLVFTVTLSAAYDQEVTMSYRTVDGTATTSNNDYIAKTGTLTFAPGETTKTITIKVVGDRRTEADETFFLDLFDNSSNSLFTKSRGIGTILNDD
ncbi:MAG TPA: Calx-beta domain-containing protein [Pirellulaceae bacterium]|nr:Calx-beta domain-containing protein [Pirellulaceae bacterium]